jgi:predicted SprT family Zn-dependent metalloprotease
MTKVLTDEIKTAVSNRVKECLDIAIKHWPEHKEFLDKPVTIQYDVKNHVGGWAYIQDWTLRLNPILCFENQEEYIHQIVGHETAHLIVYAVYGAHKKVPAKNDAGYAYKRVMPHGKEWKYVMQVLDLQPDAYHSLDCSSIEIARRRKSQKIC